MVDRSHFCQHIYDQAPWGEPLGEFLNELGCEEPRAAWKNLTAIARQANFPALFAEFFPCLLEFLTVSFNSDSALHNFERFSKKILDKNYLYTLLTGSPDLLKALVILFSGSQALTDTLLNTPSHFDWLKQPDTLNKPKSRDVLYRDFYAMAGEHFVEENIPSLLRKFKRREYIRIGLRDMMGLAKVMATVEDLSNLADVCLQVAYEYADKKLRKKHGAPCHQNAAGDWVETEFAIIGMGKLGGRELNYSSDIDLIYVYTSNKGETRQKDGFPLSHTPVSNHEYFTKLSQGVTRTINEITGEGNVFRVDLNLRPEGQYGEIANSLASCEIYYESWGRTWERQALIKARVCAGSESLGAALLKILQPFIFRRSLDFGAVEEIKQMKRKIDLSIQQKGNRKGNIKLGFGGIREIEFTVQAYQLLFGGRDKALRVSNTLLALEKLRDRGLVKAEEHDRLREAYVFLRNLENRVQMSFSLQTHVLPKNEKEMAVLAKKMGFQNSNREERVKRLMDEFEKHTRFVGNMFSNLFVEEKKDEAARIASKGLKSSQVAEGRFSPDLFQSIHFSDADRAFRFLETLRDGPKFSHPSEKSIQNFYAILPEILEVCARVPKPNSAVEHLLRFVENSHARETFLELFRENEKLLELLLILFGSSDFLSGILIRQPDLMDVLLDLESIYRFKTLEKITAEINRHLASCKTLEDKKIYLRKFKQGEELRIGVRYLIKESDLLGTLTDLSVLAEVYLNTVLNLAGEEVNKQFGRSGPPLDGFAIFAMGKLGGRELNFGSDLDIVFVYQEPEQEAPGLPQEKILSYYVAVSQMIFQLTSEMTPAGFAYKVDTDLRPEGVGGVLVHSLKGYEDYFKTRARIWERQAMTRARFAAGNADLGEKFLKAVHEFTYRPKLEYGSLIEISRLRERMEKELAKEIKKGKNVKLGYGGLADIEFTVQVLQLMHGYRNPRLRRANTLEALSALVDCAILEHNEADRQRAHYLFLRNLECALRLLSQPFSNHLPGDETEQAPLARLLGYEGETSSELAGKLIKDYAETTDQVRAFYRKTLDTLLRTSL